MRWTLTTPLSLEIGQFDGVIVTDLIVRFAHGARAKAGGEISIQRTRAEQPIGPVEERALGPEDAEGIAAVLREVLERVVVGTGLLESARLQPAVSAAPTAPPAQESGITLR